ncbi:MAG: 50S ribosomal protein L24 [Nanoarchaeota archaeon]
MESVFSKSWKKSGKAEKQRKYVYNAPYHIRGKLMQSPLSKELRKKYNKRSVRVKTGDKVKILRGQFKGKEGKIESVDLGKYRVYVEKIELIKKDGTKTPYPIHPSNVMLTDLDQDDKKRFKRLTQQSKTTKSKEQEGEVKNE